MQKTRSIVLTGLAALLALSACSSGSTSNSNGGGDHGGGGEGGGGTPVTQTQRLMITNSCSYTIWIQQQNMPSGVPSVVALSPGSSQQWAIPEAGLAATRLWPKKGCDVTGENCLIGQSSSPCPAGGCPPPVDSKIEATWGCTLADQTQCAVNPSSSTGALLGTGTSWDMSAVDGYTFPYTATVSDDTSGNSSCVAANCTDLALNQCPTNANLSVGNGVTTSAFSALNLNLLNGSSVIGCYSPCTILTYPTFGGQNQTNTGAQANLYCCPTPPIGSSECRAGPGASTSYVNLIHNACNSTVYGYAYDDGNGLRNCSGSTQIHVTFGPSCP